VLAGAPGDGAWARDWISAPAAVERRLEILAALEARSGELGPADADTLAEAALSAPQPELRERARKIVRAHAGEAVVINGLLEALPSAPRLEESGELIADLAVATLPAASDPGWPSAARAALVLRLMDMLLLESELGAADRLAGVLAAAHVLSSGSQVDHTPPPDSESGGVRLWLSWIGELQRAEQSAPGGVQAESIALRREARLALAHDPIRRFCASQVGALEAMARVVALERPSLGERVETILAQAAEARRSARSVLHQIDSAERAMVELWLLRLAADGEARS
jgi:hypothetical protein